MIPSDVDCGLILGHSSYKRAFHLPSSAWPDDLLNVRGFRSIRVDSLWLTALAGPQGAHLGKVQQKRADICWRGRGSGTDAGTDRDGGGPGQFFEVLAPEGKVIGIRNP